MSTTTERHRAPWGAVACGLAPRASGEGLADLDLDGLVRVSFAFDGAPRPDVEQLLAEAQGVRRDGRGRVRVLAPRTRLEELARATPCWSPSTWRPSPLRLRGWWACSTRPRTASPTAASCRPSTPVSRAPTP